MKAPVDLRATAVKEGNEKETGRNSCHKIDNSFVLALVPVGAGIGEGIEDNQAAKQVPLLENCNIALHKAEIDDDAVTVVETLVFVTEEEKNYEESFQITDEEKKGTNCVAALPIKSQMKTSKEHGRKEEIIHEPIISEAGAIHIQNYFGKE